MLQRVPGICLLLVMTLLPAIAQDTPASLLKDAEEQNRAGDYRKALAGYSQALALTEATQGPDSIFAADVCLKIAAVDYVLGEHPAGLRFASRALAIYEKHADADPLSAGRALAAIGAGHVSTGQYNQARPYFERAVSIYQERVPGTLALADVLNHFAYDLLGIGDYAAAKINQERALVILDHSPGDSSTFSREGLRNYGLILSALGDFYGAELADSRALAILEKQLGPEDVSVGDLLVSLGNSAKDRAQFERAQDYYERAARIYQFRLGCCNTRVGGVLDSLGQTLIEMKRYPAARETLERALAIQKDTLGSRSIWTANLLQGLAKVAAATGDYREAERLFGENLDIWNELLGHTHPYTISSLTLMADVLAHLGKRREAFQMALDAARLRHDQIALTARTIEERQAIRYAAVKITSLDTVLNLASNGSAADRRDAWEAVIQSRALVLDEMAVRRRAVRDSTDPELPVLTLALADARSKLATIVVQGKGKLSNAEYDAHLESAREQMQRAEQAVAIRSVPYRSELARENAGFEEIRKSLTPGTALVAYVHYLKKDFTSTQEHATPAYLAFVIRSGGLAPLIVPIGSAERVDSAVGQWRTEIDRERSSFGRASKANETSYRQAASELRRMVWDPVAPALRMTTQVYIVPDGALHLVNFAALPSGDGRYLVEDGPTLHLLGAERDLVSPAKPAVGKRMLAIGNPLFQPHKGAEVEPGTLSSFRGSRSTCADFVKLNFEALPGSEAEVRSIAELWTKKGGQVQLLTGAGATESAVKQQAAHHVVLHFATHGFFLNEECRETAVERENPLLRSGLALAGANGRNTAPAGSEDGILTAEEVASLDLDDTAWVVLSGCDTGLGDIRNGEGVLGLTRAFQEAGARTVITSLWPVEDEETRLWMTSLYTARFEHGKPTARALRDADLQILQSRRAKGQSTHPFHWAGFVAVGDWR